MKKVKVKEKERKKRTAEGKAIYRGNIMKKKEQDKEVSNQKTE